MKISNSDSTAVILKEIGQRIKQYRITSNLTQAELADRCGISHTTQARIESGTDSKLSNYIRILSVLNISENFDQLIPDNSLDLKLLYEGKPKRQRYKKKQSENPKLAWIWAEDKRGRPKKK